MSSITINNKSLSLPDSSFSPESNRGEGSSTSCWRKVAGAVAAFVGFCIFGFGVGFSGAGAAFFGAGLLASIPIGSAIAVIGLSIANWGYDQLAEKEMSYY